MKLINARFSDEKRVKLILMCVVTVIAMLFSCCFSANSESSSADEEQPWGRLNLIRTSHSTDNYSVIETQRNKISARGMYTGDNVRKLYIDSENAELVGTYSMTAHKDGSYEAELSCEPEKGEHKLVIKLNSGATLRYRMFYDSTNGWYFPVNGFAEKNRRVFDHIFEAPDEAAAIYLSPTKDAEEISTALEQIAMLAEQATAGLEDDYEKAKAISAYISARVYYDIDAKESSVDASTVALCNVLKTGRTVCAGFTNLFCAMAEAVGIDAVNIKGGAANGEVSYSDLSEGRQNHEWAAFYYESDKRWVWVDACWDGNGEYRNGEFKESTPKYMYFDISDEAFSLDHRADKAERRHYYSAKTETQMLGAETEDDGEPSSVITSQQTDAPDEQPREEMPIQTDDLSQTTDYPVSDQSDTVYIIIIAVLAAAVIAAAAITIRIIVKGRKI